MDKPRISIDDFNKIEVKIGTIKSAEKVQDTDKLLSLVVDFNEISPDGEKKTRQIISGISTYVDDPKSLVGKQLAFVTNLEPRTIRGLESDGMLFAVGSGESFAFLSPDREVPAGTSAH